MIKTQIFGIILAITGLIWIGYALYVMRKLGIPWRQVYDELRNS